MIPVQGFRIESQHSLASDRLPKEAFTTVFDSQSAAVATAIESVENPSEQEVRVVDVATGKVVWRSTEKDYN